MTSGDAQILDRGYRRFDGRRAGVPGAVRSVAWHTTRGLLGLGRKFRFKIVPILILLFGFLPAIGFAAFVIIARTFFDVDFFTDEVAPEYWELVGNSVQSVILFTALMAPDALVRDRRDGMVSLYLTTPLTRWTYLLSKAISVVGVLSIIIVLPSVLYLVALTFAGAGPDGFVDWIVVFVRIVVSGLAASVVYGLISMAASSLTDRRSFAVATVILAFWGAFTTVQILVEVGEVGSNLRMLDPISMPLELVARFFGGVGSFPEVATSLVYLSNLGWAGAAAALLWWRYRSAGV